MGASSGPGTLYCAECGRPTPSDELARFGELLVCPACKNIYAQKLREGVAPTAALRYAGFWIRFLALIIDGIIGMLASAILQYAILGTITPPTSPPPGTPPEQVLPVMMEFLGRLGAATSIGMAFDAVYQALFVHKLGGTPGKLALGLKVVRPNGGPIGLGRAFGRYFAKILSGIILMIGYIIAAFDSEKRALHDMICDTRVIRAREL